MSSIKLSSLLAPIFSTALLSHAAFAQCLQLITRADSQPAVGFFNGSQFGSSIAARGNWAVIGEPFYSSGGGLAANGRIVVYHRTPTTAWTEQQVLDGPLNIGNLGASVAVDDSDPTCIVVAAGMPSVNGFVIYSYVGGTWYSSSFTFSSGVSAGTSIATNGRFVAIGDPNASPPVVLFFTHNPGQPNWAGYSYDTGPVTSPPCEYGAALSMSGDRVMIGAPSLPLAGGLKGSVTELNWNGTSWAPGFTINNPSTLLDSDFGRGVALDHDHCIVGAPASSSSSGEVWAFTRGSSSWSLFDNAFGGFATERLGAAVAAGDIWYCNTAPGFFNGQAWISRYVNGGRFDAIVPNPPYGNGALGVAAAISDGFVFVGDPTDLGGRGVVYAYHPFVSDCNANGVDDICDLIAGNGHDCNGDGVLDSCEIAAGAPDCNGNGVPDSCEGIAPLNITVQPASNSAAQAGGQQTFSVVVNGGPPTFAWRKNGVPLSNGGAISGVTTATLTINPVSASSVGTYDVVITGPCDMVTSSVATLDFTAGSPFCTGDSSWIGNAWDNVMGGASGEVRAAVAFDDGTGHGTRLYVGGSFTHAGPVSANNVAMWDGTNWTALDGLTGGSVNALAVADLDGPGGNPPYLFAAGTFTSSVSGGTSLHEIARWTGSAWVALGTSSVGVSGGGSAGVAALCTHQNFTGGLDELWVGGDFSSAGGQANTRRIARWSITGWSSVSSSTSTSSWQVVTCLTSFDDGSGMPIVYAGVEKSSNMHLLMQFNQPTSDWIQQSSLSSKLHALQGFDPDGAGPIPAGLYVGYDDGLAAYFTGGSFNSGIPTPVDSLALSPAVGSTPAELIIGGNFTSVLGPNGLISAGGIASYDGTHMSAPAPAANGAVEALVVATGVGGGTVQRAFFGGNFSTIGSIGAGNLASTDMNHPVCPCSNLGAAGHGCASSVATAGAQLTSTGLASIATDTLVLIGTSMPNSPALFFQGTTQVNNGAGAVFGDGLRCAGGSVVRLGTKISALGTSRYPVGGDMSVSARGHVTAAGAVRSYQVWYRNSASFCTSATSNTSNGYLVTWLP